VTRRKYKQIIVDNENQHSKTFVKTFYQNENYNIYQTIILPVVICGYETWFCTREECRLKVFENRFLRRIFGP
jgi:hypothetical protein